MSYLIDIQELNRKLIEMLQNISPVRMAGIEFVIETLHYTHDAPNYKTGWHEHLLYELSIMEKGSMTYEFQSSEANLKETDNLIFIPPGTIHQRFNFDAPTIILGFQLHIKAINPAFKPFVNALPSKLKSNSYEFDGSEDISETVNDILRELIEEKPFYISRTEILMREFLIAFFRKNFYHEIKLYQDKTKSAFLKSAHHEYIARLVERFVSENLGRQITLDEMARYCSVSKRHLNRIFLSNRGISLGNYVVDRKIDAARQKLMQNNSLVKDLAYELGFSNTPYFCRLFKKKTGKTPDEYRRRI